MKVLLLTRYPRTGASSRLRALQYLPLLQVAGIEVTVSNLFDEAHLADFNSSSRRSLVALLLAYLRRFWAFFTFGRYDLVWIEKELFPYLPPFAERLLKLLGKQYLVDYDDAIFHQYEASKNPIVRRFLANKIDVVMRHSACVVAGNDYLAARAEKAGAPWVQIIPTVLNHTRYLMREPEPASTLVIGWIGSPSTQRYVLELRSVLEALYREHGAHLVLVGARPELASQFGELPVEVLPWSEVTEAQVIAGFDIGIMPLHDGPWERGKCGYKLIQYMAAGKPVVASPVGVNIEIVQHWQCGELAESSSQWSDALSRLLVDSSLRQSLGKRGRQAVEQHYSLQAQAPRLANILLTTIKKG